MLAGALNDVKKSTIANYFRKAGFGVAKDDRCLGNQGNDAGCLDSECCELLVFPAAIPDSIMAWDFVSADDSVQAVVDRTDAEIVADIIRAEDANSSSGEKCDEESQSPRARTQAPVTSVMKRTNHQCTQLNLHQFSVSFATIVAQ